MQLNTQEVKTLLHHREPYLMVTQVLKLDEKTIKTQKVFGDQDHFIAGHFPGAPVVPGAMLQEACTQSAGVLLTKFYSPVENYDSEKTKGYALGVLKKVEYAKYLEMVKPHAPIEIEVELLEDLNPLFLFKAKVSQEGRVKAKLSFKLANISDHHLLA